MPSPRWIAEDAASTVRQIGLVDFAGRAASFTGADCTPWCGHLLGDGYAIQGNMLTGPDVLAEMERAFLAAEAEELAERIIAALEAGQAVGGDKRGKVRRRNRVRPRGLCGGRPARG